MSKTLSAQDTKVYFGSGGMYSSFQDTRFSNIQHTQFSYFPELGFTRVTDNNYWLANVSGFAFVDNFAEIDTIEMASYGFNLRLGYLRKLGRIYLGATWDVVDYMQRDNSLLGNNADFYKFSTDIFASSRYLHDLNEDWKLEFGLDYGILSFINSAPSFTANFPQNVVDNGEVSFIDENSRDPFSIKLMEAKPFWQHFHLRMQTEVKYKKRLSLMYIWMLRSYADNKSYPITNALHTLTIRFNFIHNHKRTDEAN